MRTRTSLAGLAALAALSGCIVYEKDVIHHGDGPWGEEDSGRPEPVEEPVWTFTPSTVAQGETELMSLSSSLGGPYDDVVDVEIYGDAAPYAVEVLAEEILVTVIAYQDAALGPVDALIVDVDGSGTWVEDGITIVAGGE